MQRIPVKSAQDDTIACFSALFRLHNVSRERLPARFCGRFERHKQVDFGVPVWYDRNRYQTGRIPKNGGGFCWQGTRALPAGYLPALGKRPVATQRPQGCVCRFSHRGKGACSDGRGWISALSYTYGSPFVQRLSSFYCFSACAALPGAGVMKSESAPESAVCVLRRFPARCRRFALWRHANMIIQFERNV